MIIDQFLGFNATLNIVELTLPYLDKKNIARQLKKIIAILNGDTNKNDTFFDKKLRMYTFISQDFRNFLKNNYALKDYSGDDWSVSDNSG